MSNATKSITIEIPGENLVMTDKLCATLRYYLTVHDICTRDVVERNKEQDLSGLLDVTRRFKLNGTRIDDRITELGVYQLIDADTEVKYANVWIVKQAGTQVPTYVSRGVELLPGLYRTRSGTVGNSRLVIVRDDMCMLFGSREKFTLPFFFDNANYVEHKIEDDDTGFIKQEFHTAMAELASGRIIKAVDAEGGVRYVARSSATANVHKFVQETSKRENVDGTIYMFYDMDNIQPISVNRLDVLDTYFVENI